MGIKVIIIVVQIALSMQVFARPISYSGASTLMGRSNEIADSLFYHYSPTYKYSVGLETVANKVSNLDYTNVRFTYLLNRVNSKKTQRNLYFLSGVALDDEDNYFYGYSADWESRKWFSGAGYKQTYQGKVNYNEQYLQLGFAPYVGDYGALHTWVMLIVEKSSLTSKWQAIPALKFFYANALIEMGFADGDTNLHLIYRF